ncbi:MAG TPA: MCP four helix bundle domain-containing protein, partial [Ramlibacter sp.]|uniref:methyl-accepting chemotaxis protein n=1 Tax=Ramlibacter sp. TaxID=1917967 RepID=UPI002D5739CA
MKISTRLMAAFGLIVALTMLLGGVTLYKLKLVDEALDDVVKDRYAKISVLVDLKDDSGDIARQTRTALLWPAEAKGQLDGIDKSTKTMAVAFDKLEKFVWTPKGRTLFDAMKAAYSPYSTALARFSELAGADKMEEAKLHLQQTLRPAQSNLLKALNEQIDFQQEMMVKASVVADTATDSVETSVFAVGSLACLISIALAVWIVRSITGQLGGEPAAAAELAKRVADGDLSVQISVKDGDNASLLAALKRMQESLSSIVNGVRQNADSVATASGQISQGNSDLSSRTEEQASALQQTAASMKQLASTVKQNADNAQQGNELALAASTVAVRG